MTKSHYPKYQYSVFLRNGRDEQIVIRADDWKEFIEAKKKTDKIIKKVKSTKPKKKETKKGKKEVCPKCGGKLLYKETKSGKKFVECENREYDYETKQTSGCEYIKWNVSAPENKNKPSKKQEDLIKDMAPDKWSEELTKSKASKIIGDLLNE